MIKYFLLVLAITINFSVKAQTQSPATEWDDAELTLPTTIEGLVEHEELGAYKALKSWTKLPKSTLEKLLTDYSVVKVVDPVSDKTKFIETKAIIDGGNAQEYTNYYAIMPKAYADTTGQVTDEHSQSDIFSTAHTPTNETPEQLANVWSSDLVVHLSYITIGFACFILVVTVFMAKYGMTTNSIMRINGLILVVTSSVFLVIVGYSQEQIAPVIGLLGAIAGYLLGNNRQENSTN